jgi:hypothetical protein
MDRREDEPMWLTKRGVVGVHRDRLGAVAMVVVIAVDGLADLTVGNIM